MNQPLMVVAAIIENGDGQILLAQRPPGKHLAGLWEFPGGKIELDETPEMALRRELKEELDVRVLSALGVFPFRYDLVEIELHVFQVEALGIPHATQDVRHFRWCDAHEVRADELAPADVVPLRTYLRRTSGR